jgi:cation diffusion facilitator CzcD-associated flavoprotein CzcO
MRSNVLADAVRWLSPSASRLDRIRPPLDRSRPSTTPTIAVLGAGAGGLCTGVQLRRAGIETFTVYEKSDGVGGTWRDNTYPGACCDAKSHLYSFSFARWPYWSRRYASQAEILDYLERVADVFGLRPHLRTNTEVTALTWDEDDQRWHLRLADGSEETADVVVSGLGQLNRPWIPDLAGLDTFTGTTFHSARWNHDHDLRGERVAVIGNAASAIQFIPPVAEQAGSLRIFQRSANWIFPRPNADYSPRTVAALARLPGVLEGYRAFLYAAYEARFGLFRKGSPLAALMEQAGRRHLESVVADPALRRALTPDYQPGCKRMLISSDYYPALCRDHVEVVTSAIERITPRGIVTADGVEHAVDTIVFATGFDTTHFLAPLTVTGRDGRLLADAWHEGAEAHHGITVSGFPNLFLLYGPNTNLGHNSIIYMIEAQVHYLLGCLDELAARGAGAMDVRPEVQAAYNRALQTSMRRLVWEAGCRSWYKNEFGKVTNNWPHTTLRYWFETRRPDPADYTFTSGRRRRDQHRSPRQTTGG